MNTNNLRKRINDFWRFVTYDIWRISESDVTRTKFSLYNAIKTVYLCIDRFIRDRILSNASALTYSTLLAIVPMMAILFAVARGFGFSTILETQFRTNFGGSPAACDAILQFVNSYIERTKGGVFIGIGLVMLLWTVLNLISNIETTFNYIWGIKKARSVFRKITDYFSMLLLMPILIIVSTGLSLFVSAFLKGMTDYDLLAPFIIFLIKLLPFVVTWIMFTGLYIFMPNTKVKLRYALLAGILAGSAYQIFQYIYISSQIWVSSYNAIYGSFAALPLFLLWLQISWTICLFGAELSYAGQNIQNFSFDRDTRCISRRYRDFISILIMSLIAKRFEKNEAPYTAEQLSLAYKIPVRLTKQVLYQLQEIELIHEVLTDNKSEEIAYQPSIDINKLNVAMLLDRIDTYGSENFKIDKEDEFSEEWKVLLASREEYYKQASHVLLKDL